MKNIIIILFALFTFFLIKTYYEENKAKTILTNQSDTRDEEKEFILENKQKVKEDIENSKEDKELIAQFKTNFITGCVGEGTTDYLTCECMFEYFLNTQGMDKLINFSIQINKGEISDELAEAIATAVYRCQ